MSRSPRRGSPSLVDRLRRRGRSAEPVTALDDLARTVHRLSVLLAAGVPPAAAWRHLDGPAAASVAPVAARGGDVSAALTGLPGADAASVSALRGLAAAWSVALDSGAPLAGALRQFAAALRGLAQTERQVRTALAGPIATARIVLVLPAIGVLFGVVLGFDTLGVLVGSPLGWACLAIGLGLLVAAWAWMRALVRRARPADATPGLRCELVAIAVSGGGALSAAVARVDAALERVGIADDASVVGDVLALSERAGVPAAELLRAEAEEARRSAGAEAERRAAALGVTLMLPLGLCVLPAFIALGVVPLLAAVISSTVGSF
ncbi:type II secretion system F family protein [Galbitalea sp. SE-J8]|uniref:type II secretion system F family protein n=1 Tax=Galbitalea sp. SE-J8 TaxID=3054952 RepID=UPI00259D0A2F|nr:type II secretion system F family protein [Galbitalea sp. SE-J8]MDM4763598.1 type II secretion system F family protein [Galbitalea sp. SE-J8]